MKELTWCSFLWDQRFFPDPAGMLSRIKAKGIKICVWINPYIAEASPLFEEGAAHGYLLHTAEGDVYQVDYWQPGMGFVDFTNPDARAWYASKLKALIDMGVDCFKTDFGERIPPDVRYFDGSDPERMHNYYTYLYNQTVFELLRQEKGDGEAVLFCPLRHDRQSEIPGSLGRRQQLDLPLDGRNAARRAVAGAVRIRLLEPRHQRVHRHGHARSVQTLGGVWSAVLAQPPARQRQRAHALAV